MLGLLGMWSLLRLHGNPGNWWQSWEFSHVEAFCDCSRSPPPPFGSVVEPRRRQAGELFPVAARWDEGLATQSTLASPSTMPRPTMAFFLSGRAAEVTNRQVAPSPSRCPIRPPAAPLISRWPPRRRTALVSVARLPPPPGARARLLPSSLVGPTRREPSFFSAWLPLASAVLRPTSGRPPSRAPASSTVLRRRSLPPRR